MKANRKGICIRVVAALLVAVLFMSLCPVIPSASAAEDTYTLTFELTDIDLTLPLPPQGKAYFFPTDSVDKESNTRSTNHITVKRGESAQLPSVRWWMDDSKVLVCWEDEDGNPHQPGDVITPTGDMTFTGKTDSKKIAGLVWFYTVIIDPGLGSGTKYIITKDRNSSIAIPTCPAGFSKAGCVFDGWQVRGTTETIPVSELPKKIDGKTYDGKTFDAIWKEYHPEYKINYHFNSEWGSYTKDEIIQGYSVEFADGYNHTIKTASDAFSGKGAYFGNEEPRPKGYVFAGWSTKPEGPVDSTTYAVGKTVTLMEDLDLYAVWEPASFNYTVNYHFKDSVDGMDVETKQETGSARLDDPIPYDKSAKTDSDGKTYAFDSVAEEKVITQVAENNVIDVYYYLDTLSDEKESQNDSDNIPDIYQKVITYKVNNGTWDNGYLDQINEIVTLRDEYDALSLTGTAKLEKVPDETTAHADPGMTHYLWDTPDDARPTTVSYNDSGVYILDFFNAENALIIYPQPVVKKYDGNWHTFEEFVVHDYQGNECKDITVTWKEGVEKPERAGRKDGTPEGGDEINLETVLNNASRGGWRTYFTISGTGVETKHKILEGGRITINPAQVTVKLNVDSTDDFTAGVHGKSGDETVQPSAFKYDEAEHELIVEYVFDGYTHTVELGSEDYSIDGLIEKDKTRVKLSPDGDVILAATYVTDPGDEPTIDLTEALTFYQGDEPTSSYVVKDADGGSSAAGIMAMAIDPLADGEKVVDGSLADKTIDKITVRIVPRPVTYWTFGGARIFDGNGIPSDASYNTPFMNNGKQVPEKTKDKYHFIVWPRYEAINRGDGRPIGSDKRGFVVRANIPGSDFTPLNHYPSGDEVNSPVNAGITNCREGIEGFMDGIDHTKDYAIDYKLGYFTIYPQSITDNKDTKYHDVKTYISDDATNYDGYVAAYDANVEEYTYLNREKGDVPESTKLPAFYTGVKLVNEPAASYTAPYKFEGELLRNENNAEGYKDLKRGTDYTVTYQRQNAAGEWEDTKDFTKPGTIQVTYTGIGNYRNRIVRTYELTEAPDPGPDPDPEPDPGPDVEINDHEHYAYMIGKPGGMIDPEGEITRAEIATIIFRLLKEDVREEYWSKTNSFPDVEITDWYNNAISTLENLGIVEGKGDGLYHPEDPITRAEMATMMARLYDYDVNTGDFHTKFDDIDPDAWYARYVAAAEDLGLFVGDGATDHFYPERSLSRAEAMTVYNRLLGRKPHNDGLLPEEQMILWPDNMDTAVWYYADVQEATNSHTCDMDGVVVDDKHYELWLEPLPVRDWAALERAWSEAYSGYDGHDVN